ncbi:DEAD/DEAH box helicase [Kribbella sp. NBC_01510]|uniref:TOTE conflict system archaeo-eukaryotic primase domain-containing protein n=1 Tax=Kribbella sp. NBC_01510 TaxID=2903581 RepID=UPI00386ED963
MDTPGHDERSTTPVAQELSELRALVARLRSENTRLLQLLKLSPAELAPPGPAQTGIFESRPGPVDSRSSADAKVAFFRALFAARTDIYAERWQSQRTGRSGWLPAVRGGWNKGVQHRDRHYLPLSTAVITAHLSGQKHIGLYPLLDGDSCCWLAADFDGQAAMLDALAYVKAARSSGVPAALEVSRSGVGAHVWIFFAVPVPAETARRMGFGLIREAMALRGRMDLSSYDRLFPSQDVVPAGGVGNLIAAPLSGQCRRDGTTVFLDLASLEPYDDQWAYLSSVPRMSPREVSSAARRLGTVKVGSSVDRIGMPTSTRTRPAAPPRVQVHLGAGIRIASGNLPPALLATLKHAASMPNPLFYERQRLRLSTWDVPRFLRSFDETVEGDLVLPRGLAAKAIELLEQAGSQVDSIDERSSGSPQQFEFAGALSRVQQAAVDTMAGHEQGVLVAPPGAGKTVIACALIAKHQVSTLVLVDRKALADQWRTRIGELLRIKAGQLGGGRSKTRGTVDVAMLQTLARRNDIATFTNAFGLVVVDECHHLPAAAFEHAVKQVAARQWIGLTATPYRRDQLDDLIGQQTGPIRHTIAGAASRTGEQSGHSDALDLEHTRDSLPSPRPVLHVHETEFRYTGKANPSEPGGIAAVYRELVADEKRTTQVVEDVLGALARRRHCLVLTQWTEHVEAFATALRQEGRDPVVLRGGLGAKARTAALERLKPRDENPLLVIATGPYVGEGFDCPVLDTLFLAAPIAFKGRLVQYAGRILRSSPGKTTAEIHDYVDTPTRVLASALAKRAPGYTSLGFPDPRRSIT